MYFGRLKGTNYLKYLCVIIIVAYDYTVSSQKLHREKNSGQPPSGFMVWNSPLNLGVKSALDSFDYINESRADLTPNFPKAESMSSFFICISGHGFIWKPVAFYFFENLEHVSKSALEAGIRVLKKHRKI